MNPSPLARLPLRDAAPTRSTIRARIRITVADDALAPLELEDALADAIRSVVVARGGTLEALRLAIAVELDSEKNGAIRRYP